MTTANARAKPDQDAFELSCDRPPKTAGLFLPFPRHFVRITSNPAAAVSALVRALAHGPRDGPKEGAIGRGHRSGVTKLRLSRAIDNASADGNDTKLGVERPLARGRQHRSAPSFGNIIRQHHYEIAAALASAPTAVEPWAALLQERAGPVTDSTSLTLRGNIAHEE